MPLASFRGKQVAMRKDCRNAYGLKREKSARASPVE